MDTKQLDVSSLQQGDVVLRRVEGVKGTKVARTARGYVLAYGEVTGHSHRIEEEVELYEADGKLYLKTEIAVPLRHEEHRTVEIPPGIWEADRVREYDYLTDTIERVRD